MKKLTLKQQYTLLAIIVALLIFWGVYKLGYLKFSQQDKYDLDDEDNEGANLSATFSASNTAKAVFNNLDGPTDYDVFMDTMDMLLALSNDELVASYNSYTSQYGDTDWPTMRSNIIAENLENWLLSFPISGWAKIDDGEEARNQVIYRFDQLNLV